MVASSSVRIAMVMERELTCCRGVEGGRADHGELMALTSPQLEAYEEVGGHLSGRRPQRWKRKGLGEKTAK